MSSAGSDEKADSPDTETLLRRAIEILTNCRTLPLSSSVRLDNRDEVVGLLDQASQRLPDELKRARWLLRERAEFLEKKGREGDDIVDAARIRAERMVQRAEIVREAEHAARKTVEEAREEARRLRHEAEDYCDQKLAAFEIVLERTMKTVQVGREKLTVIPPPPADGPDARVAGVEAGDDTLATEDTFFDQDRR